MYLHTTTMDRDDLTSVNNLIWSIVSIGTHHRLTGNSARDVDLQNIDQSIIPLGPSAGVVFLQGYDLETCCCFVSVRDSSPQVEDRFTRDYHSTNVGRVVCRTGVVLVAD